MENSLPLLILFTGNVFFSSLIEWKRGNGVAASKVFQSVVMATSLARVGLGTDDIVKYE